MNKIKPFLQKSCQDLSLQIYFDYEIIFPNDKKIVSEAYMPNLGTFNGMILASSLEILEPCLSEIEKYNYGVSILGNPAQPLSYQGAIDMFSDWGWTGPQDTKPNWIKSQS